MANDDKPAFLVSEISTFSVRYLLFPEFVATPPIELSSELLDAPDYNADLAATYGPAIARLRDGIAGYDERFDMRHCGNEMGYGLFCRTRVHKWDLVGVYTGIVYIIRPDADTDYTWAYPSSSGRFGIDGKHAGNHLRFVNHDKQRVNCTVEYVPIDKKWFVVYVADRHLEVGEQVLVNYGSRYAARRKGFTNGTY